MISRYIKKDFFTCTQINMIQKPVCLKTTFILNYIIFCGIDNFVRCVKGRNKIPLTCFNLKNISP